MAQRRIPVPRKAYDALAGIIDLGVERVRKFVEAVPREVPPIHIGELNRLIQKWAEGIGAAPSVLGNAVFQVLLPANSARLDSGLGVAEFLAVFRDSVETGASDEWKAKCGDGWPDVLEALAPLFEADNFFSTAVKTTELLVQRPATLQDANVLTELRPVYDESATGIRSLLLTNTLVLTYSKNGSLQTLHLTIDTDDLQKLARACGRAEKKNSAARSDASHWGVRLLEVTSQEPDDDAKG